MPTTHAATDTAPTAPDRSSTALDDRLDEVFAALANPTRRAILCRLAAGEATVGTLAAPFDLSLPAISKHLKVLERAGLIVRGQRAQFRPCALDPGPLAEVSSWTEQYRPIWEARLDRLDGYLATRASPGAATTRPHRSTEQNGATDMNDDATPSVIIERTLDAPVDVVWRMWTEPDHFSAWYGPQGATIPVAQLDVRVGGRRFVGMEMPTPNGPMRMWFTGEFTDVVARERLVYTEAMADEAGNMLSPDDAGLPPGHPAVTMVTVELSTHDHGTKLVLTHAGVPADSPGATGWAMALDQLAEHLAEHLAAS